MGSEAADLREPLLLEAGKRTNGAGESPPTARGSALGAGAKTAADQFPASDLQRALAEYCHGFQAGEGRSPPRGPPGSPPAPRRVLAPCASDPFDVEPSWRRCASGDPLAREGNAALPSTPGKFRRHYLSLAGPGQYSEVLDFVLDVAFDVQEHHERLAQRPRRSIREEVVSLHRRQSSDVATVLVILKSFVGGTLLVMPAQFLQAGLLSGGLLFWAVGLLELWCMLKLVETHQEKGGSFSELAGKALGPAGAIAVDVSIVLSQLGFIAAEMIYVARNGSTALEWLARRFPELAAWLGGFDFAVVLTWLQLFFVIPVAWYRDLAALTAFNFVGNLLVLGTLTVLSVMTVSGLATGGVAPELKLGCPLQEALVFLGFSVFTFEGINMVIPMYTAHRDKRSFSRLLAKTIVVIIALFSVFATANVLLYGRSLQPILTLNLPQDSRVVGWVPLAFALASLVLVPLMAFPTFEILEGFAQWGCGKALVGSHWRVNLFRAGLMTICAVVARFGGPHLGAFLSLVGAVGCVPLAFVYPAVIHLRLLARSAVEAAGDCFAMAVGLGITVFCTASIFWPDNSAQEA